MIRKRITISGETQGVYFRAFIKDRATELGLNGFVRNTEDKKVEVIVEGNELKVDKLIELCKQGPQNSVVEDLKTETLQYTGEFKTFRVKY